MAKGDVRNWRKKVDGWRNSVDDWRGRVDGKLDVFKFEILAIKEDIREIKETMVTKQDFNELMSKIDPLIVEIKESRGQRETYGYRFAITSDQLADHEKRIVVLEKKA